MNSVILEDINKNTSVNFQDESNNNSPDATNVIKELTNENNDQKQVQITVQKELKKNLFHIKQWKLYLNRH